MVCFLVLKPLKYCFVLCYDILFSKQIRIKDLQISAFTLNSLKIFWVMIVSDFCCILDNYWYLFLNFLSRKGCFKGFFATKWNKSIRSIRECYMNPKAHSISGWFVLARVLAEMHDPFSWIPRCLEHFWKVHTVLELKDTL